MAQDEKAHSRLRPEVLAPVIAPDAIDEQAEEWDDDEEYPEEGDDEYENEQWDDEESYEEEDALNVEDARNVTTPVRVAVTSSRYESSGPRKISAKVGRKSQKRVVKPRTKSTGLKKSSLKKSKEFDLPPTPLGCEWRDAEDGWSLWRCWSERDEVIGGKYKKERYAGYLSRGAWGVMKQYDYETFIAVIGRRFRRHGGR